MPTRWRALRRILCVRLDNLGDVLMTTPALRAVRESCPEARITLLTSPSGIAAAPHLDAIDDAIAFDAPWVKHDGADDHAADLDMVARLADRRFDAAIIFTVFTQSPLPAALICRLAGIRLRLAHARENPYRLLSDWVPEPDSAQSARHEVRRQLDLVASIGFSTRNEHLGFRVDATDRQRADAILEAAGIGPGRQFVIVHPGASAASRRYPAGQFGVAAAAIASRTGLGIVLTGSAGEAPLVEATGAGMGGGAAASLAGRLTLGELAAVIDRAEIVVTNNSGPAHLAAALATPVVDLYALTNPQHTPWRVPHRILNVDVDCKYCFRSVCPRGDQACLTGVGPEEVADAAIELLDATRRSLANVRPLDSGRAASLPARSSPDRSPEVR